jgi:hypothetical protein
MNWSKTCPCCGNVIAAYTINLNRLLVAAFIQFAEGRIRAGEPVRKSELRLGHSQYGNFQKLRHFGLIEKRDGQRWEMTSLGWQWLRGQAKIHNPSGHMANAALPPEHPAWSTHEEPRRLVSITEMMPEEWKVRAHYAAEKAGAA